MAYNLKLQLTTLKIQPIFVPPDFHVFVYVIGWEIPNQILPTLWKRKIDQYKMTIGNAFMNMNDCNRVLHKELDQK